MDETFDFTEVAIDADIDDHYVNSTMPGEHIDRRSSGEEIEDHLARYGFGIGAYSLIRDAMIGGQGENYLSGALWTLYLANCHQAGRDLFQPAETSQRLG
jgi:hypothetical protein